MARLKQSVMINGKEHWVTGKDLQSLLNSCIRLATKEAVKEKQCDLIVPYAQNFFNLYKSDQQTLTKVNRERIFKNHIRDKFENKRFSDVSVDDVQTWMNDLAAKYSHETLLKIKNTISPVFDSAVEDGFIPSNPFKSSKIVIKGTKTVSHKSIPKDKVNYLRNNLHLLERKRDRLMAALLSTTGMRFEEVLGLKYEDVKDGWINISRAVVHPTRNQPQIKTTKTKTSTRKIPCPSLLKEYITDTIEKGFIVTDDAGKNPLSYTEARRSFDEIRKTYDLMEYTAHDFRDTCATEWRESGIPLDVIARMLGHSKTETTEKRYVKYREEIFSDIKKII